MNGYETMTPAIQPIPPVMTTEDPLWSAKTVREYVDAPDRTFRRWLSAGRFPPPDLRIGTSLRWRRSTVLAWVQEKLSG